MFLIETPEGERLLVKKLSGHDNCKVISKDYDDITLQDAKASKRSEVEGYLRNQIQGGFTPRKGQLAGHTLQTNKDKTNWLMSQIFYSAQINKGCGKEKGAIFRAKDNSVITCTFEEGLDAILAMSKWNANLLSKSWNLKDKINSLKTLKEVSDFNVAEEWCATGE